MELSQKLLNDDTLHELRKQVKYLLYQMQLCEEVWPSYFTTFIQAIKEVSDLLGNDHNLVEALKMMEDAPENILSASSKASLKQSFTNERLHLHEDTWPLMAKIFSEDSDAFIKRIKSYWLIGRQG